MEGISGPKEKEEGKKETKENIEADDEDFVLVNEFDHLELTF
jgi:hypothetical protein